MRKRTSVQGVGRRYMYALVGLALLLQEVIAECKHDASGTRVSVAANSDIAYCPGFQYLEPRFGNFIVLIYHSIL